MPRRTPALIDTPFIDSAMSDPARRAQVETQIGDKLGRPEQIAESISWLLSRESDFVHGATLVADGGLLMH